MSTSEMGLGGSLDKHENGSLPEIIEISSHSEKSTSSSEEEDEGAECTLPSGKRVPNTEELGKETHKRPRLSVEFGDVTREKTMEEIDIKIETEEKKEDCSDLPDDFLEPLDSPTSNSNLGKNVAYLFSNPGSVTRQFWKAGDYSSSHSECDNFVAGGIDRVRVHPKFLHSNATSHKWALGAVAELLDNALDEAVNGATFVNVDMIHCPSDGLPMLVIRDNGGGMDPDRMRQCMSLGYSAKSKIANTIGQYGNGFKTSTMRLGADVVVFSRYPGKEGLLPTQSIGLLSYTFLTATKQEDIIVPMVDWEVHPFGLRKLLRGSLDDWNRSKDALLKWSPFSTLDELFDQLDQIKKQGTIVIVYNLWEDDQGDLELDFDSDPSDIQLRGTNRDEKSISMAKQYQNCRHYFTYRYSLRSYASILYLRLPPGFKLILRGREIEHHRLADDLMFTQEHTYKPQKRPEFVGEKEAVAVVRVGFIKDASEHIDMQGFNVYHKNRLIKPFWRIWNLPGIQGRGIVGILEANFVEPAHDKQGFERTIIFTRLEAHLLKIQRGYWTKNCHKVGYGMKSLALDGARQPAVGKYTNSITKQPSAAVYISMPTNSQVCDIASVPHNNGGASAQSSVTNQHVTLPSLSTSSRSQSLVKSKPFISSSLPIKAMTLCASPAGTTLPPQKMSMVQLEQSNDEMPPRVEPTECSVVTGSMPLSLPNEGNGGAFPSLSTSTRSQSLLKSDKPIVSLLLPSNAVTSCASPTGNALPLQKRPLVQLEQNDAELSPRIEPTEGSIVTGRMALNSPKKGNQGTLPAVSISSRPDSLLKNDKLSVSSPSPLNARTLCASPISFTLPLQNRSVMQLERNNAGLPARAQEQNNAEVHPRPEPTEGVVVASSVPLALEVPLRAKEQKNAEVPPRAEPTDGSVVVGTMPLILHGKAPNARMPCASQTGIITRPLQERSISITKPTVQLEHNNVAVPPRAELKECSVVKGSTALNLFCGGTYPSSSTAIVEVEQSRSLECEEQLKCKLEQVKQRIQNMRKDLDKVLEERGTVEAELEEERRGNKSVEEELEKKLQSIVARAKELEATSASTVALQP